MSYILDALKKSEQERKKGEVPGLNTVQDIQIKKKRPTGPPWMMILIAALAFNGLLFGIWMYSEKPQEPVQVASVMTAPEEPSVDKEESVINTTTESAASTEKETDSLGAEVTPETPADEVGAEEQPPLQDTEQRVEPDISSSASAIEETPEDITVSPDTARETPEEVAEPEAISEGPIPFKDLAPSIRSNLPEIRISIHYYSVDPTSRRVSVNGRMLREGYEVEQGLVIKEITEDGVIFSFQETTFFYEIFYN